MPQVLQALGLCGCGPQSSGNKQRISVGQRDPLREQKYDASCNDYEESERAILQLEHLS